MSNQLIKILLLSLLMFTISSARTHEQRVNDYLQAVENGKKKVQKLKKAIESGDPAKIKKATLEIQADPAAVKELNKDSITTRKKFVEMTDAIQSDTEKLIKEKYVERHNKNLKTGEKKITINDVKIKKFTNKSNTIKGGHDWDITVTVNGKDVPHESVKDIVHKSYYDAAGGEKVYPNTNAKEFAESHHVEVTSEWNAEAYEGGMGYINNTGTHKVKDPERLSKTIEHKSNLEHENALKHEAKSNYGKREVSKHEHARQYTKQYEKHIKPRVKEMGGRIPKKVSEGTEILEKIGEYDKKLKRTYTPADADADLAKMGETSESIIKKGSALVESGQKLKAPSKKVRLKEKLNQSYKDIVDAQSKGDYKKVKKLRKKIARTKQELKQTESGAANKTEKLSNETRLKKKLKDAYKSAESANKSGNSDRIRKAKNKVKRTQQELKQELRKTGTGAPNKIEKPSEITRLKKKMRGAYKSAELANKSGNSKRIRKAKNKVRQTQQELKSEIASAETGELGAKATKIAGEYVDGVLIITQSGKIREGIKEGDNKKILGAVLGEDTATRVEGGEKYKSDATNMESAVGEEAEESASNKLKRMGATHTEANEYREKYGKDRRRTNQIVREIKSRGGKDTVGNRPLEAPGKLDDTMTEADRAVEAAKQVGSYVEELGKGVLEVASVGGLSRGKKSKKDIGDINKINDTIANEKTQAVIDAKLIVQLRDRGASRSEATDAVKNRSIKALMRKLQERDPQKAKGSGKYSHQIPFVETAKVEKDDDGAFTRIKDSAIGAGKAVKRVLIDEPVKVIDDIVSDGTTIINDGMEIAGVESEKNKQELRAKIANNEYKKQYIKKYKGLIKLGATPQEANTALSGRLGSVGGLIKRLRARAKESSMKRVDIPHASESDQRGEGEGAKKSSSKKMPLENNRDTNTKPSKHPQEEMENKVVPNGVVSKPKESTQGDASHKKSEKIWIEKIEKAYSNKSCKELLIVVDQILKQANPSSKLIYKANDYAQKLGEKKWEWFEKDVKRYIGKLQGIIRGQSPYGLSISRGESMLPEEEVCEKKVKLLSKKYDNAKKLHPLTMKQLFSIQNRPYKICQTIDDFLLKYDIPKSLVVPEKYKSICKKNNKSDKKLTVTISGSHITSPRKTVTLHAVTKGGESPIKIVWQGENISPNGKTAIFSATIPGSYTVEVSAKDARGQSVTGSISIKVKKIDMPRLSGLPNKVYYGTSKVISVEGIIGDKPLSSNPCKGHKQTSNPFDPCNKVIITQESHTNDTTPGVIMISPVDEDVGGDDILQLRKRKKENMNISGNLQVDQAYSLILLVVKT